MDVLEHANSIFTSEVKKNPWLETQKKIIFSAAILHDMCDNKYMDESLGMIRIKECLEAESSISCQDIDVILKIISTMSYSKVKKYGYPQDLPEKYMLAYHIVREADLLAAYDFNRCILYRMMKTKASYSDATRNATTLFENRVFKHNEDKLFITDYSKQLSLKLEQEARDKMKSILNLLL
jgi:HD superfamily phosphodiesterase